MPDNELTLIIDDAPAPQAAGPPQARREERTVGLARPLPLATCSCPDFAFDNGREVALFSCGRVERVACDGKLGASRRKFLIYIVEFCGATSLGVMSVPGGLKYAHILVRKRLEERGELTAESRLLLYSTRKGLAGEIDVMYQIVPKQQHAAALRLAAAAPAGLAVFDCVALLRGAIMRLPRSQTQALALALQDSVLFVVGRGRDVYFARRYPLLAGDMGLRRETVATMQRDVAALQPGLDAPLEAIRWIEPLLPVNLWTPPAVLAAGSGALPISPMPVVELAQDAGVCWSALPHLVRNLPLDAALGAKQEAWLRPLERLEPLLWAVLFAGVFVCAVLFRHFSESGRAAAEAVQALQHQIATLERALPSVDATALRPIEPVLRMADAVTQTAAAPRLDELWNRLAACKPAEAQLQRLRIAYGAESVDVELEASMAQDVMRSQALLLAFITALEREGFRIVQRSLLLESVRESRFSLNLNYAAGRS